LLGLLWFVQSSFTGALDYCCGTSQPSFSLKNPVQLLQHTHIFIFSTVKTKLLFLVKQKDLYGYINSKGKLVIGANFQVASPFYEGLAIVVIIINLAI
jgi:hypothetical protein